MIQKLSKSEQIINYYTAKNIKVFPVHGVIDGKCTCSNPKCNSIGKHPVVKDFENVATTDRKQIRKWWSKNPNYNVGVLLGPKNGICDIEFDCKQGEETATELLANVETPSYTSSRSTHRLFRLPDAQTGIPTNKSVIKVKGLEIRLGHNAAFSVAPPSAHKDGNHYQWVDGRSIAEVEIADFPDSVVDLVNNDESLEPSLYGGLSKVKEGKRHDHLCSEFGKELSKNGFTPQGVTTLFASAEEVGLDANEVVNEILPIALKDEKEKKNKDENKFVWIKDFQDRVLDQIENGDSVKPFKCGDGEFEKFCLAPGTITVIGAEPGAGKTALALQLVFDSVINQPSAKALIANVEVDPATIIKRQLARIGAVSFRDIQDGVLSKYDKKVIEEIDLCQLNICFDTKPRSIDEILAHCKKIKFDLVLIDYAQRFNAKNAKDGREATIAVMDKARRIADTGAAVIVISALNRESFGKKNGGMPSFRDTTEIEYSCDDAFIMKSEFQDEDSSLVELVHVKARSRKKEDIRLCFYGEYQRFEPFSPEELGSTIVSPDMIKN